MFATYCLSLLALAVGAYFWKMRRFRYATREIKGPVAFPIVGNCFQLMGSTEDLLHTFFNLLETYGSPMKLWIATKLVVLVSDPEDYEIILNNHDFLKKHDVYRFFRPFLGDSMVTITTDIPRWRFHRKLIAPTFKLKTLQSFIPIFQEQAQILCNLLKDMSGNGSFDVFPLMARLTVNTICEASMGVKMHAQTTNCEFTSWLDRAIGIAMKRIYSPLYFFDLVFGLTKEKKEMDALSAKLRNYTDEVIKRKKEQRKRNAQNQCVDEESKNPRKDLLDLLMEVSESGEGFTDEQLRSEVLEFISAGNDTSAGTNSYVLMMLGMHPKIQEKVFQEQQEIFGDSNRAITSEDLSQMKYLERVLKETLRMFPAVPLIARLADQDLKLRNCTIPKDNGCVLSIYATHMDDKIWKDPQKFDPDRFLPEKTAKRHPYSWIPFSVGPRSCIGMSYAMISMKTTLSVILRRYKIYCVYKNVSNIRLKIELLLKPVEGHIISLESRN